MLFCLLVLMKTDSGFLAAAFVGTACVSAVITMLFFRRAKRLHLILLILVCICVSGISFLCAENFRYLPAFEYVGRDRLVEADIIDFPVNGENRYYIETRIRSSRVKCRLSVSSEIYYLYFEDAEIGDTVSFKGTVYKLGAGNESIEDGFKSRNIFIGAFPTGRLTLKSNHSGSLNAFIKNLRKRIKTGTTDSFGGIYGGIATACLLGDKTELDKDVSESFRRAGVSHLFAVSGLHLSIWTLWLSRVFELLRFDKKRYSIVLIAFVVFIMALTGFTPSVLRAGLLLMIYLTGYILGRKSDGLNSLGLACLILLLFNPFLAGNVSFLLSVFATLGIFSFSLPLASLFEERIARIGMFRRIVSAAFSAFCVSLGAWLFTSPIIILFFGELSTLSVLTNLLIYPVVTPMMVCLGFRSLICYFPIIGEAVRLLGKAFMSWCIFVSKSVSKLSVAFFEIDDSLKIVAFVLFVVITAGSVVLLRLCIERAAEKERG